jgi:HlyD family secretion protein
LKLFSFCWYRLTGIKRLSVLLLVLFLSACDGAHQKVALGTLERDRIALTATTNEVITALPITPGSSVTKGTVLVRLDDTLQKALVDKAQADVAKAQANLEKLRRGARPEEVASARAKVVGAKSALSESQSNYQRVLSLIEQRLVSHTELDKAQAARDANEASLQSAQEALLLLTNGAREEDLTAAEAVLSAAKAVLAKENKHLADLTISATRDGILDSLPWNLGERVSMGSPLAILLAGKAPYARIYVPEPSRVSLQTGDILLVHVDGLDRPINGRLRWISTEPAFTPYYALNQEERARLMYLAEVQLPDSEAQLPNGVPVQVELP